ncbi:RBPJ-interacting and tubulin-associated protein 1-like [Glandiceps talaboti]
MTTSYTVNGVGNLSITGTRPMSATGSKRDPYHKVSKNSFVDESLFGKPLDEANFDPPWEDDVKKPKVKVVKPLLWTPPAYGSHSARATTPTSNSRRRPMTPSQIYSNRYRLKKHTPTYVDETLFGPKLQEANFDPPWAKKEKHRKPQLWSPPVCGSRIELSSRPNSAMSVTSLRVPSRPSSARSTRSTSTTSKPPWR